MKWETKLWFIHLMVYVSVAGVQNSAAKAAIARTGEKAEIAQACIFHQGTQTSQL